MNFTRGGLHLKHGAYFYGATINRTDTNHDNAIVCYESVGGDPEAAEQFRDEVLRRLQMHDELVAALRGLRNPVGRRNTLSRGSPRQSAAA